MLDQTPIDKEALNGLLKAVGSDLEFLAELLAEYFRDSPAQFHNLAAALSSNDAEAFRRAAHSLKSNSANFGALALSGRFKKLEDMGKSGNLEGADSLVTQADAEYQQVKIALEAVLKEMS
jgi:HPt (histidine-containing phosphotransfer) domain-containing protein